MLYEVITFLADDGVAPDVTANDGIFSTRLTFPTGSRITSYNVCYTKLLRERASPATSAAASSAATVR